MGMRTRKIYPAEALRRREELPRSNAPPETPKHRTTSSSSRSSDERAEMLNNPGFNPVEFDGIKMQAGLNSFTLTPKQWIEEKLFPLLRILTFPTFNSQLSTHIDFPPHPRYTSPSASE